MRILEGQNQAQKQFHRLYQEYMPRLYQGALYLLGNRATAAKATEKTWLKVFSQGNVSDVRVFWSHCVGTLLSVCARSRQSPYQVGEIVENPSPSQEQLLSALSQMDYAMRELTVLTVVWGFSPEPASRLLQIPCRLALSRLQRLTAQLCPASAKRVPAA